MEWMKTIGSGAWALVGALIGLAVAVVIGIPLGQWMWNTILVPYAMPLIAAAVLTLVVKQVQS